MRRKHQPAAEAALLEAAREAEEDAAGHRPSAAQKQQQIAELEERAAEFGDPVKQSAQAKVLERKWLRFLLVHGDTYKFDARVGYCMDRDVCREIVQRFMPVRTAAVCAGQQLHTPRQELDPRWVAKSAEDCTARSVRSYFPSCRMSVCLKCERPRWVLFS